MRQCARYRRGDRLIGGICGGRRSQRVERRAPIMDSPATNGIVERFNRTAKEEFFAISSRKRFYESVEALPADLEGFLSFYTTVRATTATGRMPRHDSRPSQNVTGRQRRPEPRSQPSPVSPARVTVDRVLAKR